jgi:hypothetical protein
MANAKQEKIVELAAFAEPLPAPQGAATIAGRNAALLKDVQVTLEFRLGARSTIPSMFCSTED